MTCSMTGGFAADRAQVSCICPGFVATELQETWLANPASRGAWEAAR